MSIAAQPAQDDESARNQSDVQLMPTFDADTTQINAFEVEDAGLYIFSQYFDEDEIFDELREWYDGEKYRFEVPAEEIDQVETFLEEYFYDLQRVGPTAIEPFCVVKEKYTDHASILRNSVYHTSQGSKTVFVMQDELSAEQALEQGATRLADSDVEFQL
ncbi:hypothetical protein [Halococcus agarilyticus]|uniref:hypothetical protein n=1 Tax=Halococcus agarilyticus TaxID=1232219 RepID=UPI001E5AF5A2|nr:hypothetical protein [Halococcus agarilyticus]